MVPYQWPVARAVPQNPEAQLEIAKAARSLIEKPENAARRRAAEIASLRSDLERVTQTIATLHRDAYALVRSELRKYGYNPQEPRVPRRNDGAGEWTRDAANDDPNGASDAPQGGRPIRLQRYGRGHHWVGAGVYRKFNLRPETRAVFEEATSGQLANPSVNHFTIEHRIYNRAVASALRDYLRENNIIDDQMTPEQAEDFYRRIRASNDPIIGGFNRRVIRERLRYIEFFYFHGGDEG